MVLVKINAKVDTATTKAMSVSGFPTMVLIDKDGIEIDRIVGFMPTEEFLGTLDDYENGIGTLDDLLHRADTTENRELYFEIADKYKYRGRPEEAIEWFTKVIATGKPYDSLACESMLAQANMYLRAEKYEDALKMYKDMSKQKKTGMFAEAADVWGAIVYREQADTVKALAAFEDFLKKYPESEDIEYAQRQIDKLNGITEEQPH